MELPYNHSPNVVLKTNILLDKKIMIVDDEQTSRLIIRRFFIEEKLDPDNILLATDGSHAIQQLVSNKNVELIMCDFNMPKMSGLEFLKYIRAGITGFDIKRNLHIVILTGYKDAPLVQTAIKLDVNSFLVKPVSRAKLFEHINKTFVINKKIKDPEEYLSVDINVKELRLANKNIFSNIEMEKIKQNTITLGKMNPSNILAQDICFHGKPLITSGSTLDKYMIDRLIEILGEDHIVSIASPKLD